MQLQLEYVIPEPLAHRVNDTASDAWNQQLTIDAGNSILFRAPSGKGKSTFIQILYGLRKDYKGRVYWDKKAIQDFDDETWAKLRSRDLSIVFQDLRLFNDLTVAENLELKQSLTNTVSMREVKEWLELLGLEQKWEQKAETLSYGERQRVAIIRSLLQPFKWLLLDEPFSHLDNENAARAAALIQRRVADNAAGLLVVDLETNNWFPYTKTLML